MALSRITLCALHPRRGQNSDIIGSLAQNAHKIIYCFIQNCIFVKTIVSFNWAYQKHSHNNLLNQFNYRFRTLRLIKYEYWECSLQWSNQQYAVFTKYLDVEIYINWARNELHIVRFFSKFLGKISSNVIFEHSLVSFT